MVYLSNMDIKNLLIQGIGFIGTLFFFMSFQCKTNKNLFRVQFLSYLFYTTHFILLGAITGGLSYILNMLRSFFLGSDWEFGKSNKMCLILCSLQIVAMAFTWAGWISLLPVIANIASTVAGYTHNGRKIRIAGMFINSPLWIIYAVLVGSWAAIADEVISEISMIVSIIRYGWKNLDKVEK